MSNNFYIRPLLLDDVSETYLSWLHDPIVTQYLDVRHAPPKTIDDLRHWVAKFDQKNNFIWGIFETATEMHLGNVTIYSTDRRNCRSHLGYMIGNRDFWGKRVLFKSLPMVFDFAFEKLLLHKITAAADIRNVSSIINLKKLGFVKEGSFKGHIKENEIYFTETWFALFRTTWREKSKNPS